LQFIIIIIIIIIITAAAATTTTTAAIITHVCLFDYTDIVIKIFKSRNYSTAFMVETGEKNIEVFYYACS